MPNGGGQSLPPVPDLLLGAKHLLVEAIALKSHHHRASGDPTHSCLPEGRGEGRKKLHWSRPRRARTRIYRNEEFYYAAETSGEISMPKRPELSVVPLPSTAHKPPPNLGPAGTKLWQAVMNEYAIADCGGLALLEQAAFAADRAERLRIEIDRDGEIIRGRIGPREHPGLRAELAARAFICRTLQRLGINLEPTRAAAGRPPQQVGFRGFE
jgi:hypothetical protein